MDVELLNFWVNNLRFHIEHDNTNKEPSLYLSLKVHKYDIIDSHVILLSNNKNAILEFFGYDTSINFDKLTERNMFEYLCTSKKLHPCFIKYCNFKTRHPKNKLHSKFDEYLKKRYHCNDKIDIIDIKQERIIFLNNAISFFGKDKEYDEYKKKRNLLNDVFKKMELIETATTDFRFFVLVYGIYQVAQMTDEEIKNNWSKFKSENWSGLRSIM